MYAKVVVDIPSSEVDELYTYIVPKELEGCIHIGSRVFVEFGFQKILGYVLELANETDYNLNLKEILEVVDFENGLTIEQIHLAKDLANDLITPLTTTLNLMYPSFMKARVTKKLKVINYEQLDAEVALLFKGQKTIIVTKEILSKFSKIKKEITNGNLELITNIYTYGKRKLVKYYFLLHNPYPPKSEKRNQVIEYLRNVKEATFEEIKENVNVSEFIVNELVESGHLGFTEKLPKTESLRVSPTYQVSKTMDLEIAKNKFYKVDGKPYLLYSNDSKFRDDFILEISKDVVLSGKKVLIISPTILENTRVTNLFNNTFDYRILAFSSKLSNNEYYYNYNELINDNVDIVIATKSGVFLPLNNIGLIIALDSESNYYLNEQNPKFSTIEILKKRALYNNSKIIFTTSSPSIVDYYEYFQNKYTIISKLNKPQNNIKLVNMKEEYLSNLLSSKLSNEIERNLNEKKISVLLLNSLAYRQTVLCSECNKLIVCPDCKVGLSYHKYKNIYQCNSCNYQAVKPVCECGATSYNRFGYGLELLKEVLQEEFKSARIMQVDSDSFTSESDYQDFHVALEEGSVDIIIGTYPLASIYHKDITLVGLINIDSLLYKNDYRSSEEVFSVVSKLMMHREAKVIIQGYNLDHYSLIDAINNNYDDFFEKELKVRKDYNYPPFNEISRLLIIGEYKDMYYFANYFKKVFARMSSMNILGPVYINRIKGVQLIVKYNDFERLSKLIIEVKKKFSDRKLIVNFERYPISFN